MLVTLSEPMTLATDYLLGTLSVVCGILLLKRNQQQTSITLWALALMAAAIGSYAGGTYHGFQHALHATGSAALWKATTISMGMASFLLLTSAFTSAYSGSLRRWLSGIAVLKLTVYIIWMIDHDEFRYVIYDYGSTLGLLLILVVAGPTRGTAGHRAYIAAGILVSIAAALVQQRGVRLHRHFNHNDLMHVVQMAGVWLIFEGGARLQDHGTTKAVRQDHADTKTRSYEDAKAGGAI